MLSQPTQLRHCACVSLVLEEILQCCIDTSGPLGLWIFMQFIKLNGTAKKAKEEQYNKKNKTKGWRIKSSRRESQRCTRRNEQPTLKQPELADITVSTGASPSCVSSSESLMSPASNCLHFPLQYLDFC